ncbi:hypothetical protein BUALT_Bualt02G0234100 [Buddleja alternifolia]|uniref:UspA domain-containing protein n=1 Tax=Buddleja alternifolia TaxID=168488 RepID=A0AAV6YDC0_9LAMI|nr:hypothetical protein BUALT_Bualt02G0234100 [Buddleja alternifolia]
MEKSVMVVGIDDSEHSFHALEWTLQHFFSHTPGNSPYKLVVVHAMPSPANAIGFIGPGIFIVKLLIIFIFKFNNDQCRAADVIPYVDRDLKLIATKVLEKAKEVCTARSVNDAIMEVVQGDAGNVLCEAVEKHHASVLVVGNHGYGAIKRAVLGSVSDYCAHHAHCSVTIVKRPPKIKD